MSLGLLLQLWCLLVVANVASTAETFIYGDESFTYFPTKMSWPEAQRHCESEGLQLAKPGDDIAVGLRKHMVDHNIEDGYSPWLSGGGDGVSAVRWTPPGGGAVTPSGPVVAAHLLWPGREEDWESRRCLVMVTARWAMERQPSRPYDTGYCSWDRPVLCQEGGDCSPPWFSLGGQCFLRVTEKRNWPNARSYCNTQKGGDLATPNSWGALRNHLVANHGIGGYWLGGSSLGTSRTDPVWTWINGGSRITSGWYPGEPNNSGGNEQCLIVGEDGLWDDTCGASYNFVCMAHT